MMGHALASIGASGNRFDGGGGGGGNSHRYWRMSVLSPHVSGYRLFMEVEYRGSVGGADLTGSGTASSSSERSVNFGADRAFDDDDGTFYQPALSAALPIYLDYDFGADTEVQEIAIFGHANATIAGRTIYEFEMFYSDNGVDWTAAGWSETGDGQFGGGETRTYTAPWV
ncbi:discoidin domain-containing protein [Shimia sp.]|uniref:discoidin domain-containing protein n=1 Tax=Shimia sp. TaxID=1954381 RepID=UPI003297B766